MQGVENSELVYAPVRETTLFHHSACKADGGPAETTGTRQRDIKIQEAVIRAQPGDTSSLTVRSWELDGHRHAGRHLDSVVPRGETSETPDPILQRGPPDLVVISHQGGVCEEHLRLFGEHCPPFVHPLQILNLDRLPSPIFGTAWIRRLLRRCEQPRASPRFRNAVLTDRPQKYKYHLDPPSASLRKQGMTPLLPPRGRSPHHFSVDFFRKWSSPHQNWKIGRGIPSPRFGAGIGNARSRIPVRPKTNYQAWLGRARNENFSTRIYNSWTDSSLCCEAPLDIWGA